MSAANADEVGRPVGRKEFAKKSGWTLRKCLLQMQMKLVGQLAEKSLQKNQGGHLGNVCCGARIQV
jgi:hypothetical protein